MAKETEQQENGIIARNKKAYFDYQIMQEFDAGIVLVGTEVKSLRVRGCDISDSYADIRYNSKNSPELFLLNLNISEYKHAATRNHQPKRPRKLLLHQREIKKLIGLLEQKGYTLVPLIVYFNHRGLAKVKLGLGKGKNERDKRDTIKKREWNRQKERELKS
jgi:SsrA-binding protein